MRNSFSSLVITGFLVLLAGIAKAQAQDEGNIESVMRSNDKIYVVLAVCITILIGLFVYLVSIDRKIARIEDKQ